MNLLLGFVGVISSIALLSILFAWSAIIYVFIYQEVKDLDYSKEAKEYGEPEGKIVDKYTECRVSLSGTDMPGVVNYFVIEKEVDGKALRRRVLVEDDEYIAFDLGEYIVKKSFEPAFKLERI